MTDAKEVDVLADFYKFLIYLLALFGLAIYFQLVQNRHYWVIMEAGLGVIYVIMFPFASTLASFSMEDGGDHLSTYLFRLMLVGMMAQAAAVYLMKDARDSTVDISVSVSNILTRGTLLLCGINGIYYSKTFAKMGWKAYFDFVVVSLLMIGDLLHMTKLTTRAATRTVGDPISLHLSVDALITFVFGSFMLGFPDMFINVLNSKFRPRADIILLTKIIGCLVTGGSVLSFASLCFRYTSDAVDTLKSKLAVYLPALLLALTNILIDKVFQTYGHYFLMLGVMGGLAVNAGYAVWQYEKEKQY